MTLHVLEGKDNTILIQAEELLSGGGIGNVTFNETVDFTNCE